MADYQVVVKPVITREMVQILPSVITDKITLPDIVEDIKNETETETGAEEDNAEKSEAETETEQEDEDEEPEESKNGEVKYAWNAPCMMVLFEDGDLNCALHHLVESLQDPFAKCTKVCNNKFPRFICTVYF